LTNALLAQPARDSAERVDTLLAEAWACRHESVPRAETLLQQALRASQQVGYLRGQAYAVLRLALCGHIRGQDTQLVDSSLQLALSLMRELGDRAGEAEALNLHANQLGMAGQHEAAKATHLQALALREALGDTAGAAASHHNLAQQLLTTGRTQEALQHLQESQVAAKACGDARTQAYSHTGLALAYEQLGDLASANQSLDDALTQVRLTQDRALECTILTARARLLHRMGRGSEAQAHLNAALALALDTGNQGDLVRVRQMQGELLLDSGQATQASEQFHQALLGARRVGEAVLEPDLLLQLARAQRASGVPATARALACEALDLAQRQNRAALAAEAQRLLDLLGPVAT
jgi:tetratricopeptide (TPR) repeat protein